MKPMRIVQTPVRFMPAVGGVEKYVLDLSLQLVAHGHQVTVICADEPSSDIEAVQHIRVKRLAYIGKIANTNITLLLLFQLLREEFDLIHTHMPTPWSAELSLLTAKIKRKPCILTYHNDVEKTGVLGVLTRLYNSTLLQIVLSNVDKILITQPRYAIDSSLLSRHRHKIVVIPNGLSCLPRADECTSVQREQRSLLFVSVLDQYHRYKGLEYLLQALTFLKQQWPDINLNVVGKGELIGEYQEQVDRLGLNHHVHFHGYVDDATLNKLYLSSTIFVLPSINRHEGFGIVLLEAMAHELPVVTTRVVGLSDDIASHCAGLVVPEKNASALAQTLNQLLENPFQTANMGKHGRALVRQKYLWSDISQSVEQIYREVAR